MKANDAEPTTIDEYIAGYAGDVQAILHRIRALIRESAPGAQEAIKYRLPTFTLNGGNLVHFGAFKEHIGFYPTPSGTEAFRQELAGYASSKGAVRFPLDQPIPYDLIREIVRFRVAESTQQAAAKATKKKRKEQPLRVRSP